MLAISEKDGVQKEWYAEAKSQTMQTLPAFLEHLTGDYKHDYGTICHALTAGAIATCWAMNGTDQGGITGFQAGAIMWEFIRAWNYSSNKTGLKLIDYDKFLYPQYAHYFEKTMSAESWDAIKREAERLIAEHEARYAEYLIKHEQWSRDIAAFIEKYPDYYERQKHYDCLGIGTGDEWDAYHAKEKSGFDFAPSEPYNPMPNPNVRRHWEDIVSGVIPFGYRIEED